VKAAGGCRREGGWRLAAGGWRLRLVGGWLPFLTFWIKFKFQQAEITKSFRPTVSHSHRNWEAKSAFYTPSLT